MKKWHKRTLCILALGIAGTVCLAYRPAFCEDSAGTALLMPETVERELGKHDDTQGISFWLSWDFKNHPKGVLLQGAEDAFQQVKPAHWDIQVRSENGKMKVLYNTPVLQAENPTSHVETTYCAYFLPPTLHYLPNSSLAATHLLHLCCNVTITPSWWQKPIHTEATLVLEINPSLGSVDIVAEPRVYRHRDETYRLITEGTTPTLPNRYCGTEREQALQHLLYEFADAALHADEKALAAYYIKAEAAVARLCTADKEWPHCWEEAAAEAERGAQLVELTLTRIQENNCFALPELADFINGSIFSRIFGNQIKIRENYFGNDFGLGNGVEDIEFEIIIEEIIDEETPTEEKN